MKSVILTIGLLLMPGINLLAEDRRPFAFTERTEDGHLHFRVLGEFAGTDEKALKEALTAAQDGLRTYFESLNPPVRRMFSTSDIEQHLVTDRKTEKLKLIGGGDMIQYRLTIEVTPDHLRQLRRHERISTATWGLMGTTGILAIIAMFFRLDEWTKGYLTTGLLACGLILAGMMTVVWWWAR